MQEICWSEWSGKYQHFPYWLCDTQLSTIEYLLGQTNFLGQLGTRVIVRKQSLIGMFSRQTQYTKSMEESRFSFQINS